MTGSCVEIRNRMMREQVEGVRDWAIACLKVARMGCQQGEGRRRVEPALMERVNGVKDWAANRLKKSKTGHHEGEGRKRVTLRVIELCSVFGLQRPLAAQLKGLHLSSVNVEEYEVLGFNHGSNGP